MGIRILIQTTIFAPLLAFTQNRRHLRLTALTQCPSHPNIPAARSMARKRNCVRAQQENASWTGPQEPIRPLADARCASNGLATSWAASSKATPASFQGIRCNPIAEESLWAAAALASAPQVFSSCQDMPARYARHSKFPSVAQLGRVPARHLPLLCSWAARTHLLQHHARWRFPPVAASFMGVHSTLKQKG